jgi:hypothetical protein
LEGLRKLTEDFPQFHAAWMLYLKNLKDLNHPEFDEALKKSSSSPSRPEAVIPVFTFEK